jgi:hypothetical protein
VRGQGCLMHMVIGALHCSLRQTDTRINTLRFAQQKGQELRRKLYSGIEGPIVDASAACGSISLYPPIECLQLPHTAVLAAWLEQRHHARQFPSPGWATYALYTLKTLRLLAD